MSAQDADMPPPSYNDAVSTPSRRAPQPCPEPLAVHSIEIPETSESTSNALSIPFPTSADLWQSRDVTHDDWAGFVSSLAAARSSFDDKKKVEEGSSRPGGLERMREVLQIWNEAFFGPRGCKVVVKGSDEEKAAAGGGSSMFVFNKDQVGIKIGSGIFGIDMSSPKGK